MKQILNKYSTMTLVAAALFLAGCIVSGTFVIKDMYYDIEFTAGGFYYEAVDVTGEEAWEDHEDDIESIDVVGFEMWITNNTGGSTTFDVWIDDYDNAELTTLPAVQANATQIIDDLALSSGANFVSYGKSLSVLTNTAKVKEYVRRGQFHYYGTAANADDGNFHIDSLRVIVTLSASN